MCDEGDFEFDPAMHHSVLFHSENVPHSLDRLHISGARFSINLENGLGAESSVHTLVLDPPCFTSLPDGLTPLPKVELRFWFTASNSVPSSRVSRKVPIGGCRGLQTVALDLCMDARTLSEDGDQESDAWHVSCHTAFASSSAFEHGIDAETEDGAAARWWNEKEHSRQEASTPGNPYALEPHGRYAPDIEEGSTILNLERCVRTSPCCRGDPWTAPSATRRSTQTLWAIFGGGRHAASGPLRQLRTCSDLGHIVAGFALESIEFEFCADIYFALSLSNW